MIRNILLHRLTPGIIRQLHEPHVAELEKHIGLNGQVMPIYVYRDKTRWFWRFRPWRYIVLDGHMLVEAMKRIGLRYVAAYIIEATVENGLA